VIVAALLTLLALGLIVAGVVADKAVQHLNDRKAWRKTIADLDGREESAPVRGRLLEVRGPNRLVPNEFTVRPRMCSVCGEKHERHFAVTDLRCDRCIAEQFDESPAGPSDWPKAAS
jgi:hypothetical protein